VKKPLIIVTVYNRAAETEMTLRSLVDTGAAADGEIMIYDNASTDGATDVVWDYVMTGSSLAFFGHENIGCPRALNKIIAECRKPGQPVIKVDNDVQFLTDGWVRKLLEFSAAHPDVALVSPWYDEIIAGRYAEDRGDWIEIFPLMGHCVYHAGDFLDQTGYFDVLSPDHLYGFEDLLMCHRAVRSGYKCGACKQVHLENIQRKNSLDVDEATEGRQAHVGRLRKYYNARVRLTDVLRDRYKVDSHGQIIVEGE